MGQDVETAAGYHRPVLAAEVVALLRPIERGTVIDATFGGGGHSRLLRRELGDQVTMIGIDRDPAAAEQAALLGMRLIPGDFGDLAELLSEQGIDEIAGVLFDFGVSSRQLDDASRGFSYRHDGPLDMRMDPHGPVTAADLVNTLEVGELADLIRRFGEDPNASRLAAAIVRHRPYTTTLELAEVVARATPAAIRRQGHPARRVFQALRIAVNDELGAIERGLDAALELLVPGGRCVTISYHSLEDRIVKRRFSQGGCTCPPDLPVCVCGAVRPLRPLTRGAVKPSAEEIAVNPRSRSARSESV